MSADLSPRPRRRPGLVAAGTALAVAAAMIVAVAASPRPADDAELLASKKPQPPIIDAGCDVDGLTVDYEASFESSPTPAEYRVVTAYVSDVSPTCAGATVTVSLLEGTTTLATATAPASSPTVTLEFAPGASAKRVSSVAVEIAGGEVPIPDACASMTFDRFTVLTAGDDTDKGTKYRDLTYGGPGNDTLRGANQDDCLDGQADDDEISGNFGNDVLLGGDGDDVLTGGPDNDHLDGGPGTDRCVGGAGNDTFDGCEEVTR